MGRIRHRTYNITPGRIILIPHLLPAPLFGTYVYNKTAVFARLYTRVPFVIFIETPLALALSSTATTTTTGRGTDRRHRL